MLNSRSQLVHESVLKLLDCVFDSLGMEEDIYCLPRFCPASSLRLHRPDLKTMSLMSCNRDYDNNLSKILILISFLNKLDSFASSAWSGREIYLQTGGARFNSQTALKMQLQGGVLPVKGPKIVLGRAAECWIRICMIAVGDEEYKQKLISFCTLKKISIILSLR